MTIDELDGAGDRRPPLDRPRPDEPPRAGSPLDRWAAQRALPPDWWSTGDAIPTARSLSVPDALRDVVRHVGDGPALIADGRVWSYAEVAATTNRIANELLARGEPGDAVSVLVGHGAAPVLGMLGVLKAGMVAAPLEARDPRHGLEQLHRIVGTDLVVAESASRDAAVALTDARRVVAIDDRGGNDSDPGVSPALDDPAVVFFTSGSTGTPKGVVHNHRGILHTTDVFGAVCGLHGDDRVAISGLYSFAGTALRAFGAMLHGATGVPFDPVTNPVSAMPAWIDEHRVTVLTFVPSVLRAFGADAGGSSMSSVRLVTVTGDVLYGADVVAARRCFPPTTTYMNRFGSTESMGVAMLVLRPGDPVPDGPLPLRMLAWNQLRLEDDAGNEVEPGHAGRMVVVGGATALGYWRDPAATAERFVTLADGRRALRLDDVARMRPDGYVEHLGRWDDRVKVNGVLVHPTQVEHALLSCDGVAEAAVMAQPIDVGDARLVAYVVLSRGSELRGWELRRDLATRLPTRMVPTSVVLLDALPRGGRGKLDRAALPEAPPVPAREARQLPIPYRVRDLARLYAEVLGLEHVGVDDDFFDLGGDSVAAIELAAAIEEFFGVDIEMNMLLDAPTPALLADGIVRRRPHRASPRFDLRTGGSGAPFVCVAGAGGHALALRALADALDDRPFVAFQARGLEEAARPDYSVAAIAKRNLRALGPLAAQRPLVLGGFSFGGVVAYEMSRRLEAAGTPPSLLVLLDSLAPIDVPRAPKDPGAAAPSIRATSGPPHRVVGRALRRSVRRTKRSARQALNLATTGWVHRGTAGQYHLFKGLSVALVRRYRPEGTYSGRTLLVASTDSTEEDERRSLPDLGWSRLVSGRLDVTSIDTEHGGVIRMPAVTTTAGVVERAIRDAGA